MLLLCSLVLTVRGMVGLQPNGTRTQNFERCSNEEGACLSGPHLGYVLQALLPLLSSFTKSLLTWRAKFWSARVSGSGRGFLKRFRHEFDAPTSPSPWGRQGETTSSEATFCNLALGKTGLFCCSPSPHRALRCADP